METQSLKIRPCKCLVCHRPAHQHHCGVPTCKGCKTFFRRMYVSQKIDKCQFDMKCFDEAGRENCNIRCQYCRFQKCIQVGMNPSDLRISGAESLNALTTTSDNLPLLLKQLAQFDTHRTHLLKNCSYDGDPSIDEISCLTQNLNFQCTPMAHDQPIIEWSFFTALASYDFLKKLQVVQNLDIRDRSILLRQSFTIISLLSCARDASRNKMSCLKFYNGSDCFLNNALTAPAELEIISNGPVTDFFSSQRFHISSRSVLSSKLSKVRTIQICGIIINQQAGAPSAQFNIVFLLVDRSALYFFLKGHVNLYLFFKFFKSRQTFIRTDACSVLYIRKIYDAIQKTQEDLRFHCFLCYLNNPFKIYKIWLP